MNAIDLFAGAGGFTCGAELANINVIWAANHWQDAVTTHELNHKNTIHSCQDLHQANWYDVPDHDVMLASPACQGHSRAQGAERSNSESQRSTAWAAVSCLEVKKPELAIVENVTEFTKWSLYPSWCDAITRLGYSIAPHIVNAADHGVPQSRIRLFFILSKSRSPLFLQLQQSMSQKDANSIIDWNSDKWKLINSKKRADSTLRKIAAGRQRFGERFLIAYYGKETGGRNIKKPLGTIGTIDTFAIIKNDLMRMMSVSEYRQAMSFPDDYILPVKHVDAVKMLGNAVCPLVAKDILNEMKKAA